MLLVFFAVRHPEGSFFSYTMETERQPEDERSFRILVERSDNDMIAVTIMTDGILAAMPSRRRYLSFMQDELQRFGAGLKELNEVPAVDLRHLRHPRALEYIDEELARTYCR